MIKSSLTVRKAIDDLYVPGTPGMARRTVQKLSHECNMWERFTSNPPIDRITKADFVAFRTAALAAELSPTTIEGTISDVLTVLRFCAENDILPAVPMPGRRLKRRPRLKPTPSVADLETLYRQCDLPNWPVKYRRSRVAADYATEWWQCLLAAGYFLALRRDDLLTLRWSEVKPDRIIRTMQKTGYAVEIPLHDALRNHLDKLPRLGKQVFGHSRSNRQWYRWLRRMADAAGIERITFQAIRRLSAQEWEQARAGCGRLILGHAYKGADRYYLDPFRALQDALPTLRVPEGMEAGSNGEDTNTSKPAAASGKSVTVTHFELVTTIDVGVY